MRRYWPEIAWAAFAAVNIALMFMLPAWETVPFHFVWISLTLLYGIRVWPWRPTLLVLGIVMTATTLGEIHPGVAHAVEVPELAEVVLMAGVFLAMVWHARRRQAALEEVARAGDRERDFLQDASHQLRTPITIARGHAELIRRATGGEVRADADVVVDELDRLSTMSDRLLMLAASAHNDFLATEPTRIDMLVAQAADRWRACAVRGWTVEAPDPILARADPARLAIALDAVVENALHHTSDGDRILLRARRDGDGARIEVADSGSGIPPEAIGQVFNRFARVPGAHRGTGLGLAMTRAIMEAHGGTADIASGDGQGTTVALRLPATA